MDTTDSRRRFSGPNLLQIAMPMGGIGAGCVCLNGHGGLQDFAWGGRPAATAMPDGHGMTQAAFALLHVKGKAPVTRLVEGPLPVEKVYDQSLQSQGYRKGGQEGLPRFAEAEFTAEYPFGHVRLADSKLPLAVTVTGWSPFVPGDDVVSSMPVAMLEYRLENVSKAPVEYEFSYHVSHPAVGRGGWKGTRTAPLPLDAGTPGGGVLFTNTDPADAETSGSAAVVLLSGTPRVKATWLRGGWFDALSALWREVSTGAFAPHEGTGDREIDGRNGGSLLVSGTLAPGGSVTYPVLLAWHFPNRYETHGAVEPMALPLAMAACDAPGCDCGPAGDAAVRPRWRPFYAGRWADAAAVARAAAAEYGPLRARTRAFADALHGSTLPAAALDAVASNLAILKSPTVLRQENGNVWAWEGCFVEAGCCHGTCTHVWNYAQALPHLFSALERTLREQELLRSLDDRGHVTFRAALPDGPTKHDFYAAADGQLGGILKLYREWRVSGDGGWLARLYPLAVRSLEYCIRTWDPDERGALFEPHHNTYDIEFWGADPMCSTIYVAALAAMAKMARGMGDAAVAARCDALADKGARLLDTDLFNGEYYVQKVQWKGLRDTSFARAMEAEPEPWDEVGALLRREGPKYQYGDGCLSDGVIGAWMAALYGVETPLDRWHVRSHLRAVFAHNFKEDLSEHACTQRPGYATGREPGLLLCTWPRGGKPVLPFVYSDEVWTGIEYQVATHLIAEGMVDEGLAIVEAVRRRYDGRARNPFNEYECGSYYARAMASYGLLQTLSGFRYDAVDARLTVAPKRPARPFRAFFSTAAAWGTLELTNDSLTVAVLEGELPVKTVRVGDAPEKAVGWGTVRPERPGTLRLG